MPKFNKSFTASSPVPRLLWRCSLPWLLHARNQRTPDKLLQDRVGACSLAFDSCSQSRVMTQAKENGIWRPHQANPRGVSIDLGLRLGSSSIVLTLFLFKESCFFVTLPAVCMLWRSFVYTYKSSGQFISMQSTKHAIHAATLQQKDQIVFSPKAWYEAEILSQQKQAALDSSLAMASPTRDQGTPAWRAQGLFALKRRRCIDDEGIHLDPHVSLDGIL